MYVKGIQRVRYRFKMVYAFKNRAKNHQLAPRTPFI